MEQQPKEVQIKESPDYKPTDDQESWIAFVYERFKDMQAARQKGSGTVDDWEAYWDESDKAYNAYVTTQDSDDWRSNLHIPIEWSITETIKQEMMEQVTRFKVEPGGRDDVEKAPFMNETLSYALDKMNWDVTKYLSDHERITRGTSALRVTYRREEREVFDPIDKGFEKKTIQDYDDVYIQYRDIFNIYPDDMARSIEDCRDLIEREILHINEFHRIYDNIYPDAKYVKAGGDTEQKAYYTPPQDETNQDVEVLYYYNKPLDKYIIIANSVLVRNDPIPYAHKQIPYAFTYGYRDTSTIWGKSVPKVLKPLVDEFNTMRNLRIDFQHMSIDKMFLISDQLDLDEEDLVVRPHGFIPVSVTTMPLQNYIQPLEYGDIKPSSEKDIDMLLEDVRRTVGVDDRVQAIMPQGGKTTATEAAILKEATLKRISMMVKLAERDGLKRIGDLLVKTIQQYYQMPKVKKIVGEDGKEQEVPEYRQIKMQNKAVVPVQGGGEEIRPQEGYGFFNATPDYIRGNFDIKVIAEGAPYPSKAMRVAKINEMIDRINANPFWQQLVEPPKSLKRYLTINDESYDDWMKENVEGGDEQALAYDENSRMDAGEKLPSTQNISEKHTLIHLERTQNADFAGLPPEIQEIFDQHTQGEQAQHGGGALKPPSGGRMGGAPRMSGPPAAAQPPTSPIPNMTGGA